MKKIRLFLPALAFILAIGAAFASHHANTIALDPRAHNGSCQSGSLQAPPSGTCTRTTMGQFCKVNISGVDYDAYDATCVSANSIRYN